jgi:multidrug efflux pump subunit AcrB
MSKFFINRPIVAMVIAILTVIVGAGIAVSQYRSSGDSAPSELCGR